ncbi:MAG: threonine--tRNA ligase [bacterium]|nr:threonine--tRNA ligase [bacterium]
MEKDILWHSTSHILATAVRRLFSKVKLGIGPAIEEGFYYDFDYPFTPEDLPKIEEEMKKIVEDDQRFEKRVVSKEEAEKYLAEDNQSYKLQLLSGILDDEVSFFTNGEFSDLCKGPHISSTKEVKAFKLLRIAGAYWKGDEKNPMLTRIYGISFESQSELDEYLRLLEEAKKRDHRKLGSALSLFSIYEEAGSGLIFYHPHGKVLVDQIIQYLKEEHRKEGYLEVATPHIGRKELWQTSGHCDYYSENMYFINKEKEDYVLKPMNCPGHILIYKTRTRSFRDLPLRYFELGTVYRYERTGVLHGLLRVRGFTQDDAHIFCTEEKLMDEIGRVIRFFQRMLSCFGFSEYEVYLATRPERFVGTKERWDMAEGILQDVLKKEGLPYTIDEGEAVFYGPKIDVKLKDCLKRSWQGPTIQVDFNLPERFGVEYIGEDGKPHQPVMIHRVVLGSMERFLGALIEHYEGKFPLWLSPVQVRIMTITDAAIEYAHKIKDRFLIEGIRVEADLKGEKIGKKIAEAQEEKIPYMAILGKKEAEENTISLRHRSKGDMGKFEIPNLIEILRCEIKEKKR